MDEPFLIPVSYKGKEHEFPASLVRRGFSTAIVVDVNDVPVTYERDDEGNWRALVPPEHQAKPPAVELLRAIGEAIEQILR